MCALDVISKAPAAAAYWLLVAALFIAQAAYTLGGLERLWYEELAEGIRNPFWLAHRLVYDGVSSNVGWYGLVLLVDKALGFSPYAAKYVRLALHLSCLICTALLLKRWMGAGRAWLPLAAAALSPTLLYFNSLGTSYGADVALLPVAVLLIVRLRERPAPSAALHVAIGLVAMFACLIFPSFVLYLPSLLVLYAWTNRRALPAGQRLGNPIWAILGFLVPFGAALAYLTNDRVFLADPALDGAGVFRGGGHALTTDLGDVRQNIAHVLQELFFRGNSYYFAVPRAEFSGVIGVAAAGGLLVAVMMLWKWKPAREPLVLAGLLCLLSLVAPAFTRRLPGLRRSTGVVSGVYVIAACAWAMPMLEGRLDRFVIGAVRIACALLVVHHLSVYLPNYRYLRDEAAKTNDPWFNRFGTPDVSVRRWAEDWVVKGKPLSCDSGSPTPCRYSEIYPAVAGYLKSGGLGEPPVMAIDPASGRAIQLTPWLWETRKLPH